MDHSRYSRQTMLAEIGPQGQKRIAEARVLVVGAGGLGSAALTYLTGAGTGTIGICEPDTVSLSNLQRQVLYTTEAVGRSKLTEAIARLKDINPEINFVAYPDGLTPENCGIVADYDLVLDCTDNFAARFLIDDACAAAGVPWIHGALGEFSGSVALFNGPRGVRYSDLFPDREAMCQTSGKTLGVVGAVPGVIGAIQASEALKYIAGFGETLDGRIFTIDLKTLQTNILEI